MGKNILSSTHSIGRQLLNLVPADGGSGGGDELAVQSLETIEVLSDL